MESIDDLVEKRREMVMAGSGLEIIDDVSGEFMRLVKDEAQHLRVHGKTNYYFKFRKVFLDVLWSIKNGVKKTIIQIDALLCRLSVYKNVIRPRLKKIYLCMRPQKKVRINRLYKLNDEEFIRELYRVFLNREADVEGFRNNLNVLQSNQRDRLDMIYTFNDSLEGGRVPVKITGKFLLRMQKESNKK